MAHPYPTVRERIESGRQSSQSSILPSAVGSLFRAADSLARSIENVAGIIEQGTEDLAEVSALMLRQQRERLLAELQPA